MKYHYLELKEGEKVIKRVTTSVGSEHKDRRMLERYQQKPGQEIFFVVSSEKEKVIN